MYTIVIDSKEQLPYQFPEGINVEVKHLKTGDYSLKGYEDCVGLERKSLDDYVKSLVEPDRTREFKKINRMKQLNLALYLVEGSLEDIANHRYNSGITPESVIGTTASIILDYNIPILFCSNRNIAADVCLRFLRMYYEHYIVKDKKVVKHKDRRIVRKCLKDLI